MQVIVWATFVVVVLMQLADAATTVAILSKPGGEEQNPILRWLMKHIGEIKALIVVKALIIAVSLVATGWLSDVGTHASLALACLFNAIIVVVFGEVLYHNSKSL